jgi:hypothetical protein
MQKCKGEKMRVKYGSQGKIYTKTDERELLWEDNTKTTKKVGVVVMAVLLSSPLWAETLTKVFAGIMQVIGLSEVAQVVANFMGAIK